MPVPRPLAQQSGGWVSALISRLGKASQQSTTYTPFRGTEKGEGERSRQRIRKATQKEAETEKETENETERKAEERTRERERRKGEGGKTQKRHTQKGTNGKGPDALDWFLHGQSLAAGDGEAGHVLTRSLLRDQCSCSEDKLQDDAPAEALDRPEQQAS